MGFRADVQGLRAVAVLPVLLFHFGFAILPGGFTGVDIFFCISGFVITSSIARDLDRGRFSIADFYFKRVRRIFPAMIATLIGTTIAAVVILLPSDLTAYSDSLLATGTFWSNIYFWRASGYFEASSQTQPLLHTWSLSIEEQFYLVVPVALALIHRFGGKRWLLFLLPVALASLAASIAALFTAPTAGFYLLPSRAWELLTGAMVALGGRSGPAGRVTREVMALGGAALIAAGMLLLHVDDPFPGWNALMPCIGTALIIQAGTGADRPTLVAALLSTRPMVAIGNISYSLYLVHWPIAALGLYERLAPATLAQAVSMLALSFGLAILSWRYVEEPWRHIAPRWRRNVLATGAASMAAIAAVAGIGVWGAGFPGRYPGYVHVAVTGNELWGGPHCFNMNPSAPLAWDAAACTRTHGGHRRVMLWGDSFAAQYVPGILADARRIDATVLQYTFAGCPPILSYSSFARAGCAPSNRAALDVIRQQRVDTVVLAARWADTPRRALMHLHETIGTLQGMGVHVVVFGQSPQFVADVQQIDFISGNFSHRGTASWPISFKPELNAIIARQASGAVFVDPVSMLCNGLTCPYRQAGKFLYSDFGHFSAAGSAIAVRRYFRLDGAGEQPVADGRRHLASAM